MARRARRASSEEIDAGWNLELEERRPESGFEQAYWEQVEGRVVLRRFGEGLMPDAPIRKKMAYA